MGHFENAITAYRRVYGIRTPANFFDIGSRDGHSAELFRSELHIPSNKVYCVDANPIAVDQITKNYPDFITFQCAITDFTGTATFNQMTDIDDRFGISSLLDRNDYAYSTQISVPTITLSDFFHSMTGETILDILKIDVEGTTWEVLQGAADMLPMINMIHLEAEHKEFWIDQVLFPEIAEFLTSRHFSMITFDHLGGQSDSTWVNVDAI